MLTTRVKSALIMLPLLILLIVGSWPLLIAVAAVSIAAAWEFYSIFEKAGLKINKISGIACIVLLYAVIIMDKFIGKDTPASQDLMMIWIGFTLFVGFARTILGKDHDMTAGIITSLGALYPAFALSHIVMVSRVEGFGHFTWLIFLAAFGTDTAAYFAGTYFGKNKLCPDISPKKTVEGSIAGILASTVLCFIFGLVFGKGNAVACLFIGLLGSVAAQMGDLAASVFKRKLGVKDYSKLIPGHGGIMDRFDSVMFAAPLVYYFMVLFVK